MKTRNHQILSVVISPNLVSEGEGVEYRCEQYERRNESYWETCRSKWLAKDGSTILDSIVMARYSETLANNELWKKLWGNDKHD